MTGFLKSSVIGAVTFVLESAAAGLLLFIVALGNSALDPDARFMREFMALLGLVLILGGSLLVLAKVPFSLASRWRANPWIALAVAGLLSGLAAHWLLFYVSFMNDCTLGVGIPYNVTICTDG